MRLGHENPSAPICRGSWYSTLMEREMRTTSPSIREAVTVAVDGTAVELILYLT